jgi:homospermidine synthase
LVNDKLVQLNQAYQQLNYAQMASLLGLAVIHVSEKDNQVPKSGYEKKAGEFVSTWSCDGFFEEGLDPVQVGWGSHEKSIPDGSLLPIQGETNQLFIPVPGVNLKMRSFVPTFGEIQGYNIPHSEGSTLSSFLTIKNETGDVIYRPTCHYVYNPPQCAIDSWTEVLKNGEVGAREIGPTRVLNGMELESGRDAVGVLLLFHHDPTEYLLNGNETKPWSYWAGTIVSVEQNLAKSGPYSAPTTVQVAASVLACVQWINETEPQGVIWPESVSHSYVLDKAASYLGDVVFSHIEWDNAPQGLQFLDFCVEIPHSIKLLC